MEIQLCVEGDGSMGPSALSAAVAAAGLPGSAADPPRVPWADSGRSPAVRVADAAGFDMHAAGLPLLRTPLTGAKGTPLC